MGAPGIDDGRQIATLAQLGIERVAAYSPHRAGATNGSPHEAESTARGAPSKLTYCLQRCLTIPLSEGCEGHEYAVGTF
jgi:hypothetical protein